MEFSLQHAERFILHNFVIFKFNSYLLWRVVNVTIERSFLVFFSACCTVFVGKIIVALVQVVVTELSNPSTNSNVSSRLPVDFYSVFILFHLVEKLCMVEKRFLLRFTKVSTVLQSPQCLFTLKAAILDNQSY